MSPPRQKAGTAPPRFDVRPGGQLVALSPVSAHSVAMSLLYDYDARRDGDEAYRLRVLEAARAELERENAAAAKRGRRFDLVARARQLAGLNRSDT